MKEPTTPPRRREVLAQLTPAQRQRLAARLGVWVRRRRAQGGEVRPRRVDPGGAGHERDE